MSNRAFSSLLGTVFILSASGIAVAADMAVKAPPPAPTAPVANWSGCYIGANGGIAWGMRADQNWADIHPASIGGTPFDSIDFGRSSTTTGIGGGQFGCNWQFSPIFVVGLEDDATWTDLSNTVSQTGLTALGAPQGGGGVTMSEKTDFLGSARVRAGFIWSGIFFYGTGGVAWAHQSFSGTEFYPNPAIGSATSFSRTATGWVAGGGVESMFWQNWLLRLEFLYYGFDGATSTALVVPSIATHPANVYNWGSSNIGVVRVGLSYKFN